MGWWRYGLGTSVWTAYMVLDLLWHWLLDTLDKYVAYTGCLQSNALVSSLDLGTLS